MSLVSRVAVGGIVLTSVASVVFPQATGIQRVAWLTGCWEIDSPIRIVEEHWSAPRGGSMIGMSRTIKADSLVEYELVIIHERGGRLAYEAHPSGQAAAVFMSRTVTDSSVIFENLQHDFPQRIGYELGRGDTLTAWVEGPHKGHTRRIGYLFRRAACPGSDTK
jgi:hypothetical protein